MGVAKDIQFTVTTFQRVLNNEKHRMAVGAALRNRIQEQLRKGVVPDHYRVEWMHRGISRVIRELENLGREFNATHAHDKFSAADMVDIAQSVAQTLIAHVTQDD